MMPSNPNIHKPKDRSIEGILESLAEKKEKLSFLQRALEKLRQTKTTLFKKLVDLGILKKDKESVVVVEKVPPVEKGSSEDNFLSEFDVDSPAVFSEGSFDSGQDMREKLREAKEVKLGDAHGSALKILRGMVESGFVSEIPKDFVDLYASAGVAKNKNNGTIEKGPNTPHQKLLDAVDNVVFRLVPDRQFVLIGDLIADRGYSDEITLKLLENAREALSDPETKETQLKMINSNHDFEVMQEVLVRKFSQTPLGIVDIKQFKSSPLGLGYKMGTDQRTGRPVIEGVDKCSDADFDSYTESLYKKHFENIDLLHYSLDSDGNVVGVDTHAPVNGQELKKLAELSGVSGVIDKDNIKDVIDKINTMHKEFVTVVFGQEGVQDPEMTEKMKAIHGFVWARNAYTGSVYTDGRRQKKNGTTTNPFVDMGIVHTFGHDSSNAKNTDSRVQSVDSQDGKGEIFNISDKDGLITKHNQEMRYAIIESVEVTEDEMKDQVAELKPWFESTFSSLSKEVVRKLVDDGVFSTKEALETAMGHVDTIIGVYEKGSEPEGNLKDLENKLINLNDDLGLGKRVAGLCVFARRNKEKMDGNTINVWNQSPDFLYIKDSKYYDKIDVDKDGGSSLEYSLSNDALMNDSPAKLFESLPFSIRDAFVSRIIELGDVETRSVVLEKVRSRFKEAVNRLRGQVKRRDNSMAELAFDGLLSDKVGELRTFFIEKTKELIQKEKEKEKEQLLKDAKSFVTSLTRLANMIGDVQVGDLGGIKGWAEGWRALLENDTDIFEDHIEGFKVGKVKVKVYFERNEDWFKNQINRVLSDPSQKSTALKVLHKIAA